MQHHFDFLRACRDGDLEMVRFFVEKENIDVHHFYASIPTRLPSPLFQPSLRSPQPPKLRFTNSPLLVACWQQQADIVRYLLTHSNAEVNDNRGKKGFTPLMIATRFKDLKLVEFLCLEAKADINVVTPQTKDTAFFMAVESNCLEIVSFFLTHTQVDVNATWKENQWLETRLKPWKNASPQLIEKVIQPCATNVFFWSCWKNQVEMATLLLSHSIVRTQEHLTQAKNGKHVKITYPRNQNMVYDAVKRGHLGIIQLLFEKKVVDIKDYHNLLTYFPWTESYICHWTDRWKMTYSLDLAIPRYLIKKWGLHLPYSMIHTIERFLNDFRRPDPNFCYVVYFALFWTFCFGVRFSPSNAMVSFRNTKLFDRHLVQLIFRFIFTSKGGCKN